MANLFSTEQFAYDPKSRSFYAEASDLADEGYQHGIDITLKSQWTGKPRTFYYVGALKDADGDLIAWEYASPSGLSVTVGND